MQRDSEFHSQVKGASLQKKLRPKEILHNLIPREICESLYIVPLKLTIIEGIAITIT